MSLAVGDIHKVSFYSVLQSQIAINTLYFSVKSVSNAAFPDSSLPDCYLRFWAPLFAKMMAVTATQAGCLWQRMSPVKSFQYPSTLPRTPGAGPAGGPMAKQIAGVCTYYDATVTKAGRGRIYLPFPSSASDSGNGVPIAGYVANMQTIATAIQSITNLNDAGALLVATVANVIWHVKSKTATPVIRARTNSIWGSQRRRGDYGKTNQIPSELP